MLSRVLNLFPKITRWYVYELALTGEPNEPQPLIDVTWREGTAADIESLTVEDHGYDGFRKQWATETLAGGDRLLIGEVDGFAAHLAWTTQRQVTIAGSTIPLSSGTEYIYSGQTVERFRGKRIQNAKIRRVMQRAHSEGLVRLLTLVPVNVQTSMRNFEREGFVRIGEGKTYRFLRRFYYVTISQDLLRKISG
jgi:GNAT superfamily N-acetyltransferase